MNMRGCRAIVVVSLFLFPVLGCSFGIMTRVGTNPNVTGSDHVYAGAPVQLAGEHEHRCPVCGLKWSHRKKSCSAPVEYACKEHKAARP
jgi:hypothetical protein